MSKVENTFTSGLAAAADILRSWAKDKEVEAPMLERIALEVETARALHCTKCDAMRTCITVPGSASLFECVTCGERDRVED